MIKIFFFSIFVSTLCSKEDLDYDYPTFNDNFTYMNVIDEKFFFYCGNELTYVYFNNSNNNKNDNKLSFDNESITFFFGKKKIKYMFNETKVYNLEDYNFLFWEKTNKTTLTLNLTVNNQIIINYENYNYIIEDIAYKIYAADGEHLFIKYYYLSYFLLLFGCFIILYGSYYYNLGFVIHFFFLINFLLSDFISFIGCVSFYIYFISFAFFLISITLTLFLKNIENKDNNENNKTNENNKENENNKNAENYLYIEIDANGLTKKVRRKLLSIHIIYSISLGFTFFKTIVYYYIYFNGPLDFFEEDTRLSIYIVSLIIVIVGITILFCLNYFDKNRYFLYLLCSAFGGSLYIIKGIEYLIGGCFSSILFIRHNLQFKMEDSERLEKSLTYFLTQIALIIFSIIFQIKYLNFKKNAIPIDVTNRTSKVSSKGIEEVGSRDESVVKDEDEALINKNMRDDNSSIEENEINDQED